MKINFKIFLLFSFLLFGQTIWSQPTEKKSIFVLKIEPTYISPNLALRINDVINETLLRDYRVQVVDREYKEDIQSEREFQKNESFIDGTVVEQGNAVGAQYMLSAKIEKRNGDLIIKIHDVETEKIIGSENCKFRKAKSNNFLYNFNRVNKSVIKLLAVAFGETEIQIIRATESKKGKAKTVLLAGGKLLNLKKNQTFDIFTKIDEVVDEVNYQRRKRIGKIKIAIIEDDNFSIAKVIDGKKEVFEAFNSNLKLFVVK